jgi:hypothetical protein
MQSIVKKSKSPFGKFLLRELSDKNAKIDVVLDYIEKDQHAGRLKDPETKNTAYHLILNGDFSNTFVLLVLKKLLQKCPEGPRDLNGAGNLPLHTALLQRQVIEEAVLLLISSTFN